MMKLFLIIMSMQGERVPSPPIMIARVKLFWLWVFSAQKLWKHSRDVEVKILPGVISLLLRCFSRRSACLGLLPLPALGLWIISIFETGLVLFCSSMQIV